MKCGWAAVNTSSLQLVTIKESLRLTHIRFQQVVHGALSHFFRLVELLQGLSDLLIGDFTMALFLVVVVQTSAFQLLQMMLKGTAWNSYDAISSFLFLYLAPVCRT